MALQNTYNRNLVLNSTGEIGRLGTSSATMDAAGESMGGIGRIFLEGGSGSKTISSAGGKIYAAFRATTFSNAGTTVRIGIQNVNTTTGLENGTFDVYADLVGGTDVITPNALRKTDMVAGSKTINHNDVVAIVIEMTSRGGTDSLIVSRGSGGGVASVFPYTTQDTGILAKSTNPVPAFMIEFDDGSVGWFAPYYLPFNAAVSTDVFDYGNTAIPDEYAAVFKIPAKCSVNAIALNIGSASSGSTFEIVFYSDAQGTPTVIQTFTPDEDLMAASSGLVWCNFTTPKILSTGVWYAISLRPTTVNSNRINYFNLGSGFEKLKIPSDFGTNMKLCYRTNQTGAFTETQPYHLPSFAISLAQLDEGTNWGNGFI